MTSELEGAELATRREKISEAMESMNQSRGVCRVFSPLNGIIASKPRVV